VHLLVTDRATCARCGPGFGLILLADRVEERRVLEGELGCPNCRERYPIVGGWADLRPPPRGGLPPAPGPGASSDPEEAFRLGALLGVEPGPGFLLLAGSAAGASERLAAMLEGIEVVALDPGLRHTPEVPGVSRVEVGHGIPFRPATFRGVALEGDWIRTHLEEAIRVLRPPGRLVLLRPGPGDAGRLEEAGMELFLVSGKAVVAAL
jgi:hypothetical protein